MDHLKNFNTYLLLLCFICLSSIKSNAQDSSVNKKITYFRITAGGGVGKGYPQSQGRMGIGGTLEAAIQKKKRLYSLGVRSLGEFIIFDNTNIENNINTVDIMYGKVLSSDVFFCSFSGGISYISSEEQGEFISREGGWLFGRYNYGKVKRQSIGIPLSFKTMWIPTKYYGIGIDFYANINNINSFYTINFCHQFGKLRPSLVKKSR